jgi:hypothetical protein
MEAQHDALLGLSLHNTFDDLARVICGPVLKECHLLSDYSGAAKSDKPNGENPLRLFSCHPEHFRNCRDAMAHLFPTVISQQAHSLLDGKTANRSGIGALDDDFADLRSHWQ